MVPDGSKNAPELTGEIAPDPHFTAQRTHIETERARRVAAIAADERSLREELRAAGVEVGTVYDLVDDRKTPVAGVPVLVRHLQLPHEETTVEGIVRALSYADLREFALEPLKAWFAGRRKRVQRFIAANALASMADLDELDDLEGIHEFRDLFDHPPRESRVDTPKA
jgi:hypothetical protein